MDGRTTGTHLVPTLTRRLTLEEGKVVGGGLLGKKVGTSWTFGGTWKP